MPVKPLEKKASLGDHASVSSPHDKVEVQKVRRSLANTTVLAIVLAVLWMLLRWPGGATDETRRSGWAAASDGPLTLKGQVLGSCDDPRRPQHTTVTLFEHSEGSVPVTASVTTDPCGRFVFEGVRPGIVHLSAHRCGNTTVVTHTVLGAGVLGPFLLTPQRGLDFAMRVTDTAGEGIEASIVVKPDPAPGDPVVGTSWFPSFSMNTDADGWAVWSHPTRGSIQLTVRAEGFLPRSVGGPEPSEGPILVELLRESSLTVQVLEPAPGDQPVASAGARVRLHEPVTGVWLEGTTGPEGTVRFAALTPGSYLADASKNSLLTYRPVKSTLGEGSRESIQLMLKSGLSLQGVLFDGATSEPLEGGCVVASSRSETGKLACGVSDDKGRFRIPGLSPGRYTLVAQAAGYHRQRVASVKVSQGGGQEPVEMVLERSVTLSGKVRDEDGNPVAGARVMADEQQKLSSSLPMEFMRLNLPKLRPQGAMVLPVGELGVTLGPVPPLPIMDPVTFETPDPLVSSVTLPPGCDCLERAAATEEPDGISGPDGSFTLTGVASGEILLVVVHPEFATYRGAPLNVPSSGDVPALEIILNPGGTIGGRVLDPSGSPLSGATIWVEGDCAAMIAPVETDETGTYLVSHVCGQLLVRASLSGYFPASRSVTLDAGTSSLGVDLILEPEGQMVSARVVNPWDFPVPEALVTVTAGKGAHAVSRSVRTDRDGMAQFPALPGTPWRVVVAHDQYRTLHTALEAWKSPQEPNLKMGFAAGVSGTVKDSWSYMPVPDLEVTVEKQGQRVSLHRFDTGAFEITDLPAGPCTLIFEADGYESLLEQVNLPQASGPTEVTLPDILLWMDPLQPGP